MSPDATITPEVVCTDDTNFRNYNIVEQHAATQQELLVYIKAGHLEATDSYDELRNWLGVETILNELGFIIKTRNGETRARMILDTNQPVLKHATAKGQRVILPRLREVFATCIILVWESLNFQLAYQKGQLGRSIDWIGGFLVVQRDGVRAKVKQTILEDIVVDLIRILSANLVSKKELHSLVGKLGLAAGLLVTMRPFLRALWAALYSTEPTGALPGMVWTKQLRPSLE